MSAPTHRLAVSSRHRAPPYRNTGPALAGGQQTRALTLVIIVAVALGILPDLVHYLNVERVPGIVHSPPLFPIAKDVRLAGAVALFLVCSAIALARGHTDRKISGVVVLLLGLIVPYIISPAFPTTEDLVWIALAATLILAVWNIGASVEGLKWVAIAGSLIGTYSIIGGLVTPRYMMYDMGQQKAFIANWQLAGPFGHSNGLGVFSVLALALVPLIGSGRWRFIHGVILFTAILASASRTALIAAGVLTLWWIACRLRSVISVRFAGAALVGACAAAVLVLPLLGLDQDSFTGRGYIWDESLGLWRESPLVGLGINWFTTTAPSLASIADWSYLGSGHNLAVDILIRSGLVGICLLGLILLAAVHSARALNVSQHQIACFGYLIAFLIESCTEGTWFLLPNTPLFPVIGLVFAVVIAARHNAPARSKYIPRLLEHGWPHSRSPSHVRSDGRTRRCAGDAHRQP